jgi:chemotaxis protein MotB
MFKRTLLVVFALAVAACGIPEEQHNAVLKDLENTKIELADCQRAKEESEAQLNAQIEALAQKVAELEKTKADLQKAIDEANADLSMYESKTGGLEAALAATKGELELLRQQRVQAEARLKQFRDLAARLAAMIKSGKLTVKVRNGKMVIQLANNILFDPGKTKLREDGQVALLELSKVLQTIDRSFLVAGHTDNVPISSGRFKSNWELSTARAVEVVSFLQDGGVDPRKLAAAGYGEHDPVASNESKDGQALNRRIEIILMPNIDELPQLPDDMFGS